MRANTVDDFWGRVNKTDGCWLWVGTKDLQGYGRFRSKLFSTVRIHRIAYELVKGKIPEDLQLDHLCRVRLCCNPDHLEPVTAKENVLRGEGVTAVNARKTHCKRGHELVGDNVYIYWKGRTCTACRRERRSMQRALGIKVT